MKLASANNANELVFEVDIPSQGLIFGDGLPLGAKIKVDLVTSNDNDVNRIPEMEISDLFDINTYLGFDHLRSFSAVDQYYVNSPLVLFSASGVLPFDDDTKYKVSLTNLGGATFDVHNMDSSRLGTPIVIKKAELKATQAERTEKYGDIDFLLFNGDHTPTKLTYLVPDGLGAAGKQQFRKVEISLAQMEAFRQSFELSELEVGADDYSNGVVKVGFPIEQLNSLTLHHDTSLNQDMSYLTVDFR